MTRRSFKDEEYLTTKELAAIAVQGATATAEQTALIDSEAAITGETTAELTAKLLAKAALYRQVVAKIVGFTKTDRANPMGSAETVFYAFEASIAFEEFAGLEIDCLVPA